MFKINPSISLFVTCQTNDEIENIWNQLIAGGTAMMGLDKYTWSEKYGWVADKFGVSWQIIPKIIGSLMMDAKKAPRVMQEIMKMKNWI